MRAGRAVSLVVAVAAIGLLAEACGSHPSGKPVRRAKQRVFVMGFDGMDPTLARKWLDEGRLPNLKKLADSGTFSKLETTQPSESPVAWASFATGVNPGQHNVYDFLVRNLDSYVPSPGLVSPPALLTMIRDEAPLDAVFQRFGVDYYVTPGRRDENGCVSSEEPTLRLAGEHSHRMRGLLCAAPLATFDEGRITTFIFDVRRKP